MGEGRVPPLGPLGIMGMRKVAGMKPVGCSVGGRVGGMRGLQWVKRACGVQWQLSWGVEAAWCRVSMQ